MIKRGMLTYFQVQWESRDLKCGNVVLLPSGEEDIRSVTVNHHGRLVPALLTYAGFVLINYLTAAVCILTTYSIRKWSIVRYMETSWWTPQLWLKPSKEGLMLYCSNVQMCTLRVQCTTTIKGLRCSGFYCKAKVEIIIFCGKPKVWILNLMHPCWAQ